jgi:dienelactone hydrolase
VIVMAEMPGIIPEVVRFATWVLELGTTVVIPQLFGTPGRPAEAGHFVRTGLELCVSREFSFLSSRRRSPITEDLRALARDLHAECGGPGVGAVGMCLTGNFALALSLDPQMIAPVLSQPSLPLAIGRGARGLQLTADELVTVQERTRHGGLRMLGLRFTHDRLCPAGRFTAYRDAFGEAFEGVEIDSGPGNPHGLPRTAHSVLTTDLVDEAGHPTRDAVDRTLAFLRERLLGPAC